MIKADAGPDWIEDAGSFGLRLATLTVSFQRFRRPRSGKVRDTPSSLGALPVATVGLGHFLLPLADDEAFWIGLSADEGGAFSVSVDVRSGDGHAKPVSPAHLHVPPDCRLAGLPHAKGCEVFSRRNAAMAFLAITARVTGKSSEVTRIARIELVGYATFAARTNRAAPEGLDPNAGYKGYRLP